MQVKKTKTVIPTEAADQIKVNNYCYRHGILMFAIPNGGYKTKDVARGQKFQGVKKGVPDMFIPIPRGKFHGLFIELKRLKKYVISEEQEWWIEKLNKQGYLAKFCFGSQDAIRTIENYLALGGGDND